LRESGEIRRRGQYIPGSQCFLYLPAEHYRHQRLRQYVPTDPGLLQRLANARQKEKADNRRNWQPIHTVWERWQRYLKVHLDQAREIISQIPVVLSRLPGAQHRSVDGDQVSRLIHGLDLDFFALRHDR
jgi:hypothetical protein